MLPPFKLRLTGASPRSRDFSLSLKSKWAFPSIAEALKYLLSGPLLLPSRRLLRLRLRRALFFLLPLHFISLFLSFQNLFFRDLAYPVHDPCTRKSLTHPFSFKKREFFLIPLNQEATAAGSPYLPEFCLLRRLTFASQRLSLHDATLSCIAFYKTRSGWDMIYRTHCGHVESLPEMFPPSFYSSLASLLTAILIHWGHPHQGGDLFV